MPATQLTDAGQRYIVWHKASGRETRCIVSAHAGMLKKPFPIPPNVTIYFYVPPGREFSAYPQDIMEVVDGAAAAADAHGLSKRLGLTTTTDDYVLSKVNGYHEESSPLEPMKALIKKTGLGYQDQKGTSRWKEEYAAVDALVTSYDTTVLTRIGVGRWDIVTIRFRPLKDDVRFSWLVTELHGLGYTEIHCAFCRTAM